MTGDSRRSRLARLGLLRGDRSHADVQGAAGAAGLAAEHERREREVRAGRGGGVGRAAGGALKRRHRDRRYPPPGSVKHGCLIMGRHRVGCPRGRAAPLACPVKVRGSGAALPVGTRPRRIHADPSRQATSRASLTPSGRRHRLDLRALPPGLFMHGERGMTGERRQTRRGAPSLSHPCCSMGLAASDGTPLPRAVPPANRGDRSRSGSCTASAA